MTGRVLAFGPAVDTTSAPALQSGPDHAGPNSSPSDHWAFTEPNRSE